MGEGWLPRNVVLRRKLGDAAKDPTYIFAEPRVGYRMAEGGGVGAQVRCRVAPAACCANNLGCTFREPVAGNPLGRSSPDPPLQRLLAYQAQRTGPANPRAAQVASGLRPYRLSSRLRPSTI